MKLRMRCRCRTCVGQVKENLTRDINEGADMSELNAGIILRHLPEAFWDIDCWSQDGQDHAGNLNADRGDRLRIVEQILGMVWANEQNRQRDDVASELAPCPTCNGSGSALR